MLNKYKQTVEQSRQQMFSFACYSLRSREDAEDVLQESMVYAFRNLDRYDPARGAFRTWLYTITISRCRNARRRKWLPTFSFGQLREKELGDPDAPLPDEHLMLSARQQKIWAALRSLSPKLRETAVLRYYEGLSYPEIGQILGIPTKTADSRMRLAHAALREMLTSDLLDEDCDSEQ